MNDLRYGRLDPKIAAVRVHTGVVREALAVAAEAELVVSLIETSGAEHQFGFTVAFKSRARHNVEYSVSAVTQLCPVTSSADFQIIDVLGIELRSDIRRDIRVRNRHATHQPARLMSAADM